MKEEAKWSGWSPPTIERPQNNDVSSPAVSGVFTPAPSAGSYSYTPMKRLAKKKGKYETKTRAMLKTITRICDESPSAKLEKSSNSQWRIYHHEANNCLTLSERYTKHFATVVWVKTKFHYGKDTLAERRILKVYLKHSDRYASFDVYDTWCEWIGECPLEDIEELFTI